MGKFWTKKVKYSFIYAITIFFITTLIVVCNEISFSNSKKAYSQVISKFSFSLTQVYELKFCDIDREYTESVPVYFLLRNIKEKEKVEIQYKINKRNMKIRIRLNLIEKFVVILCLAIFNSILFSIFFIEALNVLKN